MVEVTCVDGVVEIFRDGQPLRTWLLRRASDPRAVRRRIDPNGAVSFAGRYYTAGRWLTGHVLQVRCFNGVVQPILDGELVRAWQQRHTLSGSSARSSDPTLGSGPPTPGH